MRDDLDLTTREQIVRMLKTNGELSAKAITEQLGITGMAVRRHLSVLEKEELIEYTTVRQAMGRPTAVYRLTEKAEVLFPRQYHAVALDLLSELKNEAGEEAVNHLFDLRQASMLRRYRPELEHQAFEQQIAALAGIQTRNGYMASWSKSANDEYELTEYNCPIYQVASRYKHACTCELRLFQTLLDAEVERVECLAEDGRKCVYRIKPISSRQKN